MKMLAYHKLILEKVRAYPAIFNKELRKALKSSTKEEYENLKQWYKQKFRNNEPAI
jgi:hypothetical protein